MTAAETTPPNQMIGECVSAAVKANFVVFPVKENGSKRPDLIKWDDYQTTKPTKAEYRRWFPTDTQRTGMGLLMGAISGHAECMDFDVAEAWEAFQELADEAGLGELVTRIAAGYFERTPNGIHIVYRCPDGIEGSQKLATRADKKTMIETRSEGGYIVCGPSHGKVHESGKPYQHLQGTDYEHVAVISGEERALLLALARSMDETPTPVKRPASSGPAADDAPGSLYNADPTNSSSDVLMAHGWVHVFNRGDAVYLRRPGKAKGVSATVGVIATDIARIFTTSTILEPKSYDRFGLYAALDHGGDFSAAARHLRNSDPKYRASEGPPAMASGSDAEVDGFPPTEAGDAEYFADRYRDQVRYDHRLRLWRVFDGDHWRVDDHGQIDQLAKAAIRGRQRAAPNTDDSKRERHMKWAATGESQRRLAAMLGLARSVPPIAEVGDRWDDNPKLLGVQGGVVDLTTGEVRRGRPDDRITRVAGTCYDPEAECPLWLTFLDQIYDGDTELIGFVRLAIGYSLTGDNREQVIFFLHGIGANGKSVLLNILRRLLGDYAWTLPFSVLSANQKDNWAPQLADLPGVRFVTVSEADERSRLNLPRLKDFVSSDTVNAHRKYGHPFTFSPVAKYWVPLNHLPDIADDSESVWRRIRLIVHGVVFKGDRRDNDLEEKLAAELPGILRWATRAAADWYRDGLPAPSAVTDATNEYRAESDPLAEFFEDWCGEVDGEFTPFRDIEEAYGAWCESSNVPRSDRLTSTALGKRLKERGFTAVRKGGDRGYSGITIDHDRLDRFRGRFQNFSRAAPLRRVSENGSEPVQPVMAKEEAIEWTTP